MKASLVVCLSLVVLVMASCTKLGEDTSLDSLEADATTQDPSTETSSDPSAPTVTAAEQTAEPKPEEKELVRLESRFGDSETKVFGEVAYKEKQIADAVIKEFEVEVEGGPPGAKFAVKLDGVQIGEVQCDLEGEGELELVENDDDVLPEGFPEVKRGTVLHIGDIIQTELKYVERLEKLRATIGDREAFWLQATFVAERWNGVLVRSLALRLRSGEPEKTYVLTVDGAPVGKIQADAEGEAEVKFRDDNDEWSQPFPKEVGEIKSDSVFKVEEQQATFERT